MNWVQFLEIGTGLFVAMGIATFAEYALHRLMHAGKLMRENHAKHHRENSCQGWAGEFRYYFILGLPFMPLGFLYSMSFGYGFVGGAVFYAMLAAYAHQVQHENAELVFWLRQPVHYLHHRHKMWHHNFGISISFWDHIFGTYKKCEWTPEKSPFQYPISSFFAIKWF